MQSIEKLIPQKKVHFIGIGGIGMSALAQLLISRGIQVSGSDINRSPITQRLEVQGAKIFLNHKPANVADADIVVYSSCIAKDNPEIIQAQKKKIRLLKRAQLLASLMKEKYGIAITGTHGKTTTTALISVLLETACLYPSFAVGADVNILGGNAKLGSGKYFVAEADESDGSFLALEPNCAVITNIDREHLDYYKDLKHIIATYAQFTKKIRKGGVLFCWGQDKNIRKAISGYRGKLITYGLEENCDIYARDITCQGMMSEFRCFYKHKFIGTFKLNIPGLHNVLNSLAGIGVGLQLGLDKKIIKQSLFKFSGANRRFQLKNKGGRIIIIDDYAHHPTEIIATLKAAKAWANKRVVGVFQPHRYSRTKFLKKEFGQCFDYADHVVITDIYAASETPIKGIAARTIYEQVKKNGHQDVHLLSKAKVSKHIINNLRDGDLLMMLGAGDIGTLTDELVKQLSTR